MADGAEAALRGVVATRVVVAMVKRPRREPREVRHRRRKEADEVSGALAQPLRPVRFRWPRSGMPVRASLTICRFSPGPRSS